MVHPVFSFVFLLSTQGEAAVKLRAAQQLADGATRRAAKAETEVAVAKEASRAASASTSALVQAARVEAAAVAASMERASHEEALAKVQGAAEQEQQFLEKKCKRLEAEKVRGRVFYLPLCHHFKHNRKRVIFSWFTLLLLALWKKRQA